ncbi:MAG: hypothetical protein ACK5V3_10595, partial [Bdellovibrionales bacterium]
RPHARTDVSTLLKNTDEVELPMDPAYYKRLHDKIMAKVTEKSMEAVPVRLRMDNLVAMKKTVSIRR